MFFVLTSIGFVLLGILWGIDRSRRWETPQLDAERFVIVRGGATVLARATWLVPVNLRCPSCLARAADLRGSQLPAGPRVVLLVVDQRRRPSPLALSGLDADAVWWDAHGVWRHRWGHRIYGETLYFDSQGRYRGTTPPSRPPSSDDGSEGGEAG
jgi:hypothetical protein